MNNDPNENTSIEEPLTDAPGGHDFDDNEDVRQGDGDDFPEGNSGAGAFFLIGIVIIVLAITKPDVEALERRMSGGFQYDGQPVVSLESMRRSGDLQVTNLGIATLFHLRVSFLGFERHGRILGIAGQFISLN